MGAIPLSFTQVQTEWFFSLLVLYSILSCLPTTISVYDHINQEKLVFHADIASLSEEVVEILRSLSYVVHVDVESQAFDTVVNHVYMFKWNKE